MPFEPLLDERVSVPPPVKEEVLKAPAGENWPVEGSKENSFIALPDGQT
jgi:hypothetical protein